ncbi:ETX/MTX2 family pore-forming toxin [Aquimarina sp. U1-2]|uniref:ETX/MTX2 family pore-forming toxin n=1 Tax=Aquimarina sp. U1-2 TaxID=2823141 RepID=UPI001AED0308|nr:ETX/MTX2 family pore-forming toxin [Aquimarina sp. U1-2]MBP2833214.1 ETX/MTX2 family pore-forming toxin [Aquimarina sp. U1-2]
MKNLKFKYSNLLLILGVFLWSCEKEEPVSPSQNAMEDVIGVGENKEYHDHPKVTFGNNNLQLAKNRGSGEIVIEQPWESLDFESLKLLGRNFINRDFLKNRFTHILNRGSRRPLNVSINDTKFGSGHNMTEDFNWHTDYRRRAKRVKVIKNKKFGKVTPVPGFSVLKIKNNTNKGKMMNLPPNSFETRRSTTTNWSISAGFNFKIGAEMGFPLVNKASAEFTVNFDRTHGESTTTTNVQRYPTDQVWVPAGQTAFFQLVEKSKKYTYEWHIPIEFRGQVGADYGKKRHHGHHFWSVPAKNFFYEFKNGSNKMIIDIDEEYYVERWVRSKVEFDDEPIQW